MVTWQDNNHIADLEEELEMTDFRHRVEVNRLALSQYEALVRALTAQAWAVAIAVIGATNAGGAPSIPHGVMRFRINRVASIPSPADLANEILSDSSSTRERR